VSADLSLMVSTHGMFGTDNWKKAIVRKVNPAEPGNTIVK